MGTKQHTEILGTMSIGRLVARIAVPSSVALLVTSTYNLVDAIFVGRGVGPEAIGALMLIYPIQMSVMALGSLIAVGSASVVSRALGAEDSRRARRAAGTAIGTALILGCLALVLGKLFLPTLLRLLSARDELYEPTREYLSVILFVEPILLINICTNSLIRAEGQARTAMVTLAAGMLVNIALDPLFIFAFGWGVAGAALATIIGRSSSLILMFVYFARGKSSLSIRPGDLIPELGILREMTAVGSSAFVRQFSTSLMQMVRNNLLVIYGGGIVISAFGAVYRTLIFLGMPAMGIAQALPPIVGYNYGAGKIDRVRKTLWVSVVACTIFMGVGFVVTESVPQVFLRLFSSDEALLAQGARIMRINAFLLLAFPLYVLGPAFFQALGRSGSALVLTLARPVLGLVITLVGARTIGLMGIVAADPIAVAAGAAVALVLLRRGVQRLTIPAVAGEE